jgi:hypothetical protein
METMKLKTYAQTLTELAKQYPDANIVFEENGNYYADEVTPVVGFFNPVFHNFKIGPEVEKVNGVCLN